MYVKFYLIQSNLSSQNQVTGFELEVSNRTEEYHGNEKKKILYFQEEVSPGNKFPLSFYLKKEILIFSVHFIIVNRHESSR